MNRPSNEITGMVVAKREEWKTAYLMNDGGFMPDYWVQGSISVSDPRDCHETAMDLLHHAIDRYGNRDMLRCTREGWTYMDSTDTLRFLPISSPDFRYSVVNLAAQVMGIKDDNYPSPHPQTTHY